jgi:hypothetical protein
MNYVVTYAKLCYGFELCYAFELDVLDDEAMILDLYVINMLVF